ncbi:MAG: alpha/beta fold hydrolase [Xanthobacteraceae bacterium]
MDDVPRTVTAKHVSVAGIDIELIDRGNGKPLFYLHGGAGLRDDGAFIDALAKSRRVIAPSHPGFGASGLPDWIDSVDDLAHVHLELLDKLGLATLDLVGMSLGGWIAGEMATMAPERFPRVALIAPIGVKTGSTDKLDIPDIFAMPDAALDRLRFHDPQKFRPDYKNCSDEELAIVARNNETLALLTWEPYMHNPKLKHRLHRVTAPVLLLRGVSDGIVSADYLERYGKLFPHARIATIAAAGHAAQIEQPQATATAVLAFLESV